MRALRPFAWGIGGVGILLLLVGCIKPPESPKAGILTGRVLRLQQETAIESVKVSTIPPVTYRYTDADGAFELSLCPRTYELVLQKDPVVFPPETLIEAEWLDTLVDTLTWDTTLLHYRAVTVIESVEVFPDTSIPGLEVRENETTDLGDLLIPVVDSANLYPDTLVDTLQTR